MQAEHDFRVNLNDKMNHLLDRQWQWLLEIRQIQTKIMAATRTDK
jgi:hypothetical protein